MIEKNNEAQGPAYVKIIWVSFYKLGRILLPKTAQCSYYSG